jgi:hypothetical protein
MEIGLKKLGAFLEQTHGDEEIGKIKDDGVTTRR